MLNEINLMGRLVADPELKHARNDTAYTTFRIACDRDGTNANGERETDFIECVAWDTQAEFVANHISKGQMIAVSGRLQVNRWSDADGNIRYFPQIRVNSAYFAGGRRTDELSAAPAGVRREPRSALRTAARPVRIDAGDSDDDFPF